MATRSIWDGPAGGERRSARSPLLTAGLSRGTVEWMRSWIAAAAAVFFALASGGGARADTPDPDPWFGGDKALHFGATAGIAVVGYGAASYFTDDRRLRLVAGTGLGLVAGGAKELLDLASHGDASWKDLAWDAIGTAAGLLLAWGLDVLLCGSEPGPNATAAASVRPVVLSPWAVAVRF